MKKRVLSALLAVGMACSLAATAFATDLPGMATPESASYDLAEQDPAEDAASGEPAAVEAEPTPTPDAAEQPTPTPAPTADATAEPAPESEEEDAPVQTPVPLAPATAESAAAFDASQVMENGAKVTVQAAEGVLPAGARLETGMLTDADTLARLESALQEVGEYDGFLALDIGFTLEGEPVEPAGDVQVAIELPAGALAADADPDTLALVHFAEEGEALAAEVVDAAIEPQAEDNAGASISLMALDAATAETAASDSPAVNLTFTIRSFSPFAVAWQAAAARAVNDAMLREHTVQGVTPFGTTINLFDYTMGQINQDGGQSRTFQFIDGNSTGGLEGVNNFMGSYNPPNLDLVTRILPDNGYPQLDLRAESQSNTDSLDYLFDPTRQVDGKTSYSDVGGLLQVDSDGYYYYSSHENFAEFDANTNDFILYDTWGVYKRGTSPNGQFFPFNTGKEVFTADGDGNLVPVDNDTFKKEDRNYHLGMTMSTRFVQQYGGHTDDTENAKAVTYKFSGDDDVWVYIDGVLVGDLGGIHDEATLEIDFSSGEVLVYVDGAKGDHRRDGEYNKADDTLAYGKTLRELYAEAGAEGRTIWSDKTPGTFADETYHTLNFFYLERGAGDSNMSLRYNLVTIPETDIYKVNQDNEPVDGAEFELYLASDWSDWKENGQSAVPICKAVTDRNGSVVLLEKRDDGSQGYPLTLQRLYDDPEYEHETNGTLRLMLVETDTPDGYRDTGAIPLRLEEIGQSGRSVVVLLSDDPWTTGVYALPKTLVLAHQVQVNGRYLESNELDSGTMFAVVEKKVGNDWYPVTGAPISGWEVSDEPGIAGAIKAAQAQPQPNLFVLSTSGAYQVEINGLPGRIQDYQYLGGDGFRVSYYFSEAGSLANATTENTYAVQNSDKFERQMSARLYIPNIVNRIAVQKVDSVTGNAVNGATIALYADGDVEKDKDGNPTGIKTKADGNTPRDPVGVGTTEQLTMDEDSMDKDSINLNGGVVFDRLQPGTYWIKEIEVPDGYTINDNFVKVIVDGTGVYADAGKENDGIQVTRGVGRLVRSMLQFAVDDGIDVTLHNIVATLQNGTLNNNGTWSWADVQESDEGGLKQLHLKYSGQNSGYTLDYAPEDANTYSFKVDTGIPRLKVEQCTEHNPEDSGAIKQILTDNGEESGEKIELTNLYTGTTVVHIADDALANLKIEKEVKGLGEENRVPQDTNFTFTVKAADNTTEAKVQKYGALNADGEVTPGQYEIDGGQETVTFENGAATVTVTVEQGQNTASITILGLPVGQYKVTENISDTSFPKDIGIYTFDKDTYSVSNSGNREDTNEDFTLQSPKKEADALTIQTTTVTATNEYKQGVRELLVKKTVEGDMGDTTQDFDFTLKLTKDNNKYDEPLPVTYTPPRNGVDGTPITTLEAEDNTYTFQLCHNQSIKITVPAGYTATVTETTTGQGYTVESRQYLTETPGSGSTTGNDSQFAKRSNQSVVMDADYTVEFRNTRNVVAPTGLESNHTKPYTLMVAAAGAAGLALVGAAVARYLRRRRQE